MSYIIKQKKAISSMIAIVLFILMTLIAASIFWISLKPIITDLSPEFNCAQAQIENPISIKEACYNLETNDLELAISRSIADKTFISTIDFRIDLENEEALEYFCGENCEGAEILDPGESKTYFFNIENKPTSAVIGVNGCILFSTDQIFLCS